MNSLILKSSKGRFAFWLLYLLSLPFQAAAFESWEHESVSAMSLIAATNYVIQAHANDVPSSPRLEAMRKVTSEFSSGIKRDGVPTRVTFGQIVKLVDYMTDPYMMLHPASTASGWPTNGATCNLAYLESIIPGLIHEAGPSHANYNHFGGRAFFTFWLWHKQAIEVAHNDNLFGALLLEAYADHFLEDTFAPGHLLAPRSEADHDIFTLTLHDYYNERGLPYLISHPEQLAGMERSLQSLMQNAPLTVTVRSGKKLKHLVLSTASVRAFDTALTRKPATVVDYGDNLILKNPLEVPLVVNYCARAISDVLETYLGRKEVNSFETYRWESTFFPRKFKPRLEAIDFELCYGGLTSVDNPCTVDTNDFLFCPSAPAASKVQRLTYPVTETIGPDALKNRGIGLSVGVESVALFEREDSSAHMRTMWEAGALAWGRRFDELHPDWDAPNWLPNQIALAIGYSGVANRMEQGHGGFGRAFILWPQVNMQLDLIAGALPIWVRAGERVGRL